MEDAPIATLVDLLIQIFEAPPAIKVVPEIVERLDLLLRVIVRPQHRHRLLLAEPCLALEHGREGIEEVLLGVLRLLHLRCCRHVALEHLVVWVDRVELATALRVRENFKGFLDALEERIVVGIADLARFLVGMVLERQRTVRLLDLRRRADLVQACATSIA